METFFGAFITLVVSRYYYIKAAEDLKNEASELKKLNNLMLRALEKAGLAEFNKDDNGIIKGMKINLSSKTECKAETSDVNLEIN